MEFSKYCPAAGCTHTISIDHDYCGVHLALIPERLIKQAAVCRAVGGCREELAAIGEQMMAEVDEFIQAAEGRTN